ncbi:MAG: DNA polymerase I [Patescibacteria group bacterium]
MTAQKFIIIDGNALLHRAFHALPPLTTKEGKLVNAVYGFALTFLKVLKDLKPAYLAVAFDTKAPTFRDEMYAAYKAQRITQPQELYDQIPLIKEMIRAFNLPVVELDGYEADDVIGTLAHQTTNKLANRQTEKLDAIIVTGDLDALQLVNDRTKVYTFRKGFTDTMIYDAAAVKERFGLSPEQMIDYKALRGDPSDNIPGVRGIGEKTATELLVRYKTLDRVYQTVESEKTNDIKPGVLEKLKQGKKDALLSKKLATIVQDAPLTFHLEDARIGSCDTQALVNLFRQWGFQSLVGKIPASMGETKQEQTLEEKTPAEHRTQGAIFETRVIPRREWKGVRYTLIDDPKKFAQFISDLDKQKSFVIDTETTGINPFKASMIGMSFCWKEGEAYYIDATYRNFDIAKLKPILEDPRIMKWGHNVKFDLEALRTHGINARGFTFDTMVASYLLNPGSRQHNLETVVFTEFGYQMQPIEELIGKGRTQITMDKVPVVEVANYSCEDADFTLRLVAPYRERLEERENLKLLDEIEMPLIPVLADMEEAGVKIDVEVLEEQSKEVHKALKKLETQIYKNAGQEFNINSPQQLKKILFEKLSLSTIGLGKTKTGISTAAGELEKLKGKHPIIELMMEYRELFKLRSTYLEALPAQVDSTSGRIHTDFNQTVAATGRLSSSNPNLQNIPIRTAQGRMIRKAFVAERGFRLISADYSQIELRIAASITGDAAMTTSFHRNEDIHRRTASNVLGVPYDSVTPEQRREAKTINFGILYGLGARGLAEGSGLNLDEAKDFIERYFRVHKGIKTYVDRTIADAREKGYVETLFGRRRYLPEITAQHQGLRAAAERMAINHPIQGTAADLMKKAMILVDARIKNELRLTDVPPSARPARILLQVHDELVLEVKNELVDQVSAWIKDEMESVAKLKVPIEVHVGMGKNWDECK